MQNNKDNNGLHRQLANLFYSMSVDSLKDDIDNLEGIMKVWGKEVIPQMKKNVVKSEPPDGANDDEMMVPGSAGLKTP